MPTREKPNGAPSADYKPVRGDTLTGLRGAYRGIVGPILDRADAIQSAGRTNGEGVLCDEGGTTIWEVLNDAFYCLAVAMGYSINQAEGKAAAELRSGDTKTRAADDATLNSPGAKKVDELDDRPPPLEMSFAEAGQMWVTHPAFHVFTHQEFKVLVGDVLFRMKHGEIAAELRIGRKAVEKALYSARSRFGTADLEAWRDIV